MKALIVLTVLALTLTVAGPVKFSGSTSVYGEYGWVMGDTLVQPRPELRFNLSPSLSFWGCPLSLDILLSTQENNLRQQLDKYRFFLHPSEWLSAAANPPPFALAIKSIQLGSCNPSWTTYTLSGTPVLGGAFELNPWYVYLAGAAGRSQRAVPVSDTTDGAYTRMLYSGRFGFGKKEGTHFYLTGVYSTDDVNSLPNNMLGDTLEVVQPKENHLVGAEFNLNLWNGAFTLGSEVTGSELTRDKRLPVFEDYSIFDNSGELDKYLGWTIPILQPRFSSSFDYAWKVRPALNVLETKLNGQFEYVGTGYQSLSAPNLRNDNLKLGGGIERDFFDHSLSLSLSYGTEHDNLLAVPVKDTSGKIVVRVLRRKNVTTHYTSWDASLGLSFPDLPYLQATYSPYSERSDDLDSMSRVVSSRTSAANVISVSAGHSFQTGKVSHSPGITVSYSDVRGKGDTTGDYTNWDANLNYGLGFEFPLSLAASCGYSRSVAGTAPDSRLYFDVTPSYTLFKSWRNSLTLGGTFGSGTRGDARFNSSFPIWKICDANLGANGVIYSGGDGKYNELRLTATLSKSW